MEFLLGGRKAVDGPSLMNLCMELRKCCNHPFLNRGVELDIRSHAEATGKVYGSDADLLVEYRYVVRPSSFPSSLPPFLPLPRG